MSDDAKHCGSCTTSCSAPEGGSVQCVEGACRKSCPAGFAECDGKCFRLESDPLHCGSCATACETTAGGTSVCSNGACAFQCAEKLTTCGNSCIDTRTDPLNCGSCGNVCTTDVKRSVPVCTDGVCGKSCQAPNVACDDQCISEDMKRRQGLLDSCTSLADDQNQAECRAIGDNLGFCAGKCIDIMSDPMNCGYCDHACLALGCSNGLCLGL